MHIYNNINHTQQVRPLELFTRVVAVNTEKSHFVSSLLSLLPFSLLVVGFAETISGLQSG